VRRGKFTRNQTVIFLHTGGTAALAAYPDSL
jgi:1-aminocyclopropane-1-carboxylate deaminase/D-cysteine desulfhydrase-like pyridoxal-dependent ACC family enzyme